MTKNRLAELQLLIPIPREPIVSGDNVLDDNAQALRTKFPSDFIGYGKVYGSGTVHVGPYGWDIWGPFWPKYPERVERFHKNWSDFRDAGDAHDVPLGLYPEKGGLLPFAKYAAGHWYCWKTDGEPEEWTVVVMQSYENGYYKKFDMGFTEFWLKLLNRKIKIPGYTERWDPKTDVKFIPEEFR